MTLPRRCYRVPVTLMLLVALIGLTLIGGAPAPVAAHASDLVAAVADSPTFLTDGAHLGGVTLRLAALGRGDALAPIAQVTPTDDGTRVAYTHGDVTEWYLRQGGAVEQGITLAAPPVGDGPLALTIAAPDVIPLVDANGGGATLILPRSSGKSDQWRYDGLQVTDATGHVLPSHLASAAGGVGIVVDDAEAVYPVTVDPFMQRQTLSVNGTAYFGGAVSLSADGSTALVGANGTGGGAAYVFTRGAGGFTQFGPTLVVTGAGTFGISVSLSGDGNTALVGAIGTNSYAGMAYVYASGASGFTLFATLTSSGTAYFGLAVALSADGSTALVGASGTNSYAGTACVFTRGASIASAPGTVAQHATVTTALHE